MFRKSETGSITFYYDTEALFNEVGIFSSYMAKSAANVDELGISDDEKDVFDVCVRQALPDIYDALLKMTSGLVEAISDDTNVGGAYVEFTIKDNGAYNDNALVVVDGTLYTCLKYGVLSQFYSINVSPDLLRLSQDRLTNSLYQLKQRLFQLKKKVVSSQLA